MGWLVNFLKKIGVAETEDGSELEYVHINDLSDWVKIKVDDLIHTNQLDDWLITYVNKLKDKRWLLECKIDDWEKKIITLGLDYDTKDISTIFNHSRKFLDFLTFKENPDLKTVLKLNYKLSDYLEKLQKLVEASSFAYNYTFILNKEEKDLAINPLLKELIELEQLKESFDSKIINCGYSKMDNLLDKANLIEETQERILKIKEELNSKKERFKNVEEAKEEKEKELSRILKTNDNNIDDISKRKKRETELVIILEDLDGQVSILLSKLKPAFRQQVGINQSNQLVQKYLEDPVSTFYSDKFLAINNLLRDMREQIIKGRIKLDPLQNEVSLRVIDECVNGKLKLLQQQSIRAKEEFEMLKEPAFKNKDYLMKVEEAKYRLEHFTKQGTKLLEELTDAEDELDDLRAIQKREIELFQNLMLISFGQEIEIKIS